MAVHITYMQFQGQNAGIENPLHIRDCWRQTVVGIRATCFL